MFLSIKYRLIFLLIIFTLLPFILLRIVAYPRMQSDLQDVLIRNLDGIGHKQSELVTAWTHERTKNARVVSNHHLMAKCAKIVRDDKEYLDIVQILFVISYNFCTFSHQRIVRDDK